MYLWELIYLPRLTVDKDKNHPQAKQSQKIRSCCLNVNAVLKDWDSTVKFREAGMNNYHQFILKLCFYFKIFLQCWFFPPFLGNSIHIV